MGRPWVSSRWRSRDHERACDTLLVGNGAARKLCSKAGRCTNSGNSCTVLLVCRRRVLAWTPLILVVFGAVKSCCEVANFVLGRLPNRSWASSRHIDLSATQTAFEVLGHALLSATEPYDDDDALGQELRAMADAGTIPPEQERLRSERLREIQMVARAVLNNSDRVDVLAYGSSANGCGERTSDIDAGIIVPEEVLASVFPNSTKKDTPIRQLLVEVRGELLQRSWRQTLFIPNARIPLLTVQKHGFSFDLTARDVLLPVFNTRLIRSYVELDVRVKPLILAVKRVMKAAGVCSVPGGWLSSYSWTLLTIYYLQRRGLLPSLQGLAERDACTVPVEEVQDGKRTFRIRFCSPEQAFAAGWDPRAANTEPSSLGDLFRGFFKFYGYEFAWGDEVVSVRLGRKALLSEEQLTQFPTLLKTKAKYEQLHIEDPIEVHRNLNFALNPERTNALRDSFQKAALALVDVTSLEQVTLVVESAPPKKKRPRRSRSKAAARSVNGSRSSLRTKRRKGTNRAPHPMSAASATSSSRPESGAGPPNMVPLPELTGVAP